jgi:hypothetical protein
MRDRGIRILDHAETRQVRWLLVSVEDCRDETAERQIVRSCFPLAHAAWSWPPAFVGPVVICRTRRRVLFHQQAGIVLQPDRAASLRSDFQARPNQKEGIS